VQRPQAVSPGSTTVPRTGGVVVVVLAAGLSRRFGADKLSATLSDGRQVAAVTLATAVAAWPSVICVARPQTPVCDLATAAGVEVVECPQAVDGMAHSLAAGVRARPDAAGWVFVLADMPFVHAETLRRIAGAIAGGAAIAVPVWRGRRGHPVGFSGRFGGELTALTGDTGAREVLQRHADQVRMIEVDDPGILRDVDRPSDLKVD
jgi:molybdenum cofactor cytidylyltransferase